MNLDLTQHEGFIYNLIRKWKVEDQDKEDIFQDFFIYFTKYAKYDATKGKPTTFIPFVFKHFMLSKRVSDAKYKILDGAIHIEERDKEFLDRELSGTESMVELDIYLEALLEKIDDVTLALLLGDETYTSQAKKEGCSRQYINDRHLKTMKKLIGE